MTQRDHILNELNELGSQLANASSQNIYTLPGNYFEGLAEQILNRIKALEATTAAEETGFISPVLSAVSKQMPYEAPVGYFEDFSGKMIEAVRNSNGYLSATEEIETISPLLGSLKNKMPYTVPAGYFDTLNEEVKEKANKPAAKVVSMGSRKWFRLAAAAVVTGVIFLSAFMYFNRNSVSVDNPDKWVAKSMKKVSADKIDDFIKLTDDETSFKESVVNTTNDRLNEVKELVKDIPEKEIQDFLDETEVLNESDSDIFLN